MGGERGELLRHLARSAFGAGDLGASGADEPFERGVAAVTDVFVNGHFGQSCANGGNGSPSVRNYCYGISIARNARAGNSSRVLRGGREKVQPESFTK